MKAKSEFQQSTLTCSKHSFNIYFRMKTEFIKTSRKVIKPLNTFKEKPYSALPYIRLLFISLAER